MKESNAMSTADELGKLKELLNNGAITQAEFNAQKARLLGSLPPAQPFYGRPPQSDLTCPKCGSRNATVHPITDTKTKHRGCLGWMFWILLAICTFGLILIIPLLTNSKTKTKTHLEAVCQTCGKRWRI
jgi:DNA-directed RNA polymerase subunit M/transcription elongation factor TFIIS